MSHSEGANHTLLRFSAGDVVEVLVPEAQNGWLYGKLEGSSASGWFPEAYVKPLEEMPVNPMNPVTPMNSMAPMSPMNELPSRYLSWWGGAPKGPCLSPPGGSSRLCPLWLLEICGPVLPPRNEGVCVAHSASCQGSFTVPAPQPQAQQVGGGHQACLLSLTQVLPPPGQPQP